MILGIGNDLIEIDRVKKILNQSSGSKFLERILTPRERELAVARTNRVHEFAAGRFAAKEAIVKALGCGIGESVSFQDIEILPDSKGKPECLITSAALDRLGIRKSLRIHLSISHNETTVSTFAVIEWI